MRKRGFYDFVECTDSNTKGASMLSAHEDVKYEYWCDGELIVSFKDKNKAITTTRNDANKHPHPCTQSSKLFLYVKALFNGLRR